MRRFNGDTVAVLASGPSLVEDDIRAVSHLPCVAVNNTWEVARFCSVIFAGDHKWWMHNGDAVDIPAARVSLSYNSERQYSAKRFKSKVAKSGGYNSGCIAIEYAIVHGASRVIMLGFDCSVKHGTHHHGDHKKSPNPDKVKCQRWVQQFDTLRRIYPQADVVNCSRYTELRVFPVKPLESVLCEPG